MQTLKTYKLNKSTRNIVRNLIKRAMEDKQMAARCQPGSYGQALMSQNSRTLIHAARLAAQEGLRFEYVF